MSALENFIVEYLKQHTAGVKPTEIIHKAMGENSMWDQRDVSSALWSLQSAGKARSELGSIFLVE